MVGAVIKTNSRSKMLQTSYKLISPITLLVMHSDVQGRSQDFGKKGAITDERGREAPKFS